MKMSTKCVRVRKFMEELLSCKLEFSIKYSRMAEAIEKHRNKCATAETFETIRVAKPTNERTVGSLENK
ncbi:hypothetical protein BLOT_004297 [Blomia tropicalis]|nr:hypothetical protein BLOT_004297 [Blomia tropicalis]